MEGWGEFYVIMGTSAGALTGLMFVVIALGGENGYKRSTEVAEAFATPTIVHLAAVVLISGIVTVPRQTELSLMLCLLAAGIGGLIYSCWDMQLVRKQSDYEEYWADRIWRTVLPIIGFAALLLSGILVTIDTEAACYLVGATTLLLLFAAIHNAWDSAIWIATDHVERP